MYEISEHFSAKHFAEALGRQRFLKCWHSYLAEDFRASSHFTLFVPQKSLPQSPGFIHEFTMESGLICGISLLFLDGLIRIGLSEFLGIIKSLIFLSRSVPVCRYVLRLPRQRHNLHTLPRPSSRPALHTHGHLRGLLDQWCAHACRHPHQRVECTQKPVIAFAAKLQPSDWHKESLCALRTVTGIPTARKQPTYSFSWNFYMNAIAERGPHLQGNLQSATKFTVWLTWRPHNHTHIHTHTHTLAQSWHEGWVFSVCIHLTSPVLYRHWWVVMHQQLSPGPNSSHMVSTFHNHTAWDVWSNYLSPSLLCLCVSLYVLDHAKRRQKSNHFLQRLCPPWDCATSLQCSGPNNVLLIVLAGRSLSQLGNHPLVVGWAPRGLS